jgi:hypothetical protein
LLLISIFTAVSLSGQSPKLFTETETISQTSVSKIVLVEPTTSVVTDSTTKTTTDYVTSTIQGIIPPISNVLISNISVKTISWSVEANPNTNMIYAVSPLSNLSVINGSSNKIVASLSVGPYGSSYVSIDPSRDLVFAGNAVINGSTNKILTYLPDNITGLAVDSNSNLIFAISPDYAQPGNDSLIVFNGLNYQMESRILLNGSSDSLAINERTQVVYVPICSSSTVCAPIYLIAIQGSNLSILARTLIDSSESSGIAFSIAVNPVTNIVYLTDQQLISVNGTTNQVIARTIVSAYTIQCRGVAVNSEDDEIYVTGWGFGDYGSFFIVNGQNYSLLNAFAGTGQPIGITYDSANAEIYLANSQTQSILALNSTAFVVPTQR